MSKFDHLKKHGGLFARTHIIHEKGADIAYIYELEVLKELVVKSNKGKYETALNIGDKFRFSDGEFVVKKIATRFLSETDTEFMNCGINMYGVGEILPFNFEIVYVVADA